MSRTPAPTEVVILTPETPEYPIGKDPSRHYVRLQLDAHNHDSQIEEYLDRPSLAEGEEGTPMYRVEADPRRDADLRRFTGSSKFVLLSCSKAAHEALQASYARQARAVLRPRVNPTDVGGFEAFTDDAGRRIEADNGSILAPSGIF